MAKVKANPRVKDITGQRFGSLTVLKRAGTNTSGNALWLCRCDCDKNKTTIVGGAQLRNGNTRSCGHLREDTTRELKTVHGARRARMQTPEYRAWCHMIT